MRIRDALPADLPAIRAVYAHHVLHGTGSFEERPPSLESMRARYEAIVGAGLPWLVAEDDGPAAARPDDGDSDGSRGERRGSDGARAPPQLGYAYAGPWKARSAYRFTVEDSVYVAPGALGRGVGGALLGALIARCTADGYRQMMAVVGDSGNLGSLALHRRHGFEVIGTARAIGYKFGRWLDVVYLQRALGDDADAGD